MFAGCCSVVLKNLDRNTLARIGVGSGEAQLQQQAMLLLACSVPGPQMPMPAESSNSDGHGLVHLLALETRCRWSQNFFNC